MKDLIIVGIGATGYLIGRIQQWARDQKANRVGHHLSRAFDAMRDDQNKQ